MRAVFFGLGSIARRHICHLRTLAPDCEIHAYRHGPDLGTGGVVDDVITRWSQVARNAYDIAFITNPTHLHMGTAEFCAIVGIPNLFIEKPLGVTTEGLQRLLRTVAQERNATYLAYPFRHHHQLSTVDIPIEVTGYTLSCETDLYNWRSGGPPEYSLSTATGGGVILELSHELDTAVFEFGQITDYQLECVLASPGGLPGKALIHLDHASGVSGRVELALTGTWPTERVLDMGVGRVRYSATDDMYFRQMAYFLANLGNPRMVNNLHSATPLFMVIADLHKQSVERVANK